VLPLAAENWRQALHWLEQKLLAKLLLCPRVGLALKLPCQVVVLVVKLLLQVVVLVHDIWNPTVA
jgi:hypothetical protein